MLSELIIKLGYLENWVSHNKLLEFAFTVTEPKEYCFYFLVGESH